MSAAEKEVRKSGAGYGQSPCPESHYWFPYWLRRGYAVKCTRCGATEKPAAAEHEQGHR